MRYLRYPKATLEIFIFKTSNPPFALHAELLVSTSPNDHNQVKRSKESPIAFGTQCSVSYLTISYNNPIQLYIQTPSAYPATKCITTRTENAVPSSMVVPINRRR